MENQNIPTRPLAVIKNRSGVCPCCGNLVERFNSKFTCRWCGQALEWNTEENENGGKK